MIKTHCPHCNRQLIVKEHWQQMINRERMAWYESELADCPGCGSTFVTGRTRPIPTPAWFLKRQAARKAACDAEA